MCHHVTMSPFWVAGRTMVITYYLAQENRSTAVVSAGRDLGERARR
jgi:hypothetical protein